RPAAGTGAMSRFQYGDSDTSSRSSTISELAPAIMSPRVGPVSVVHYTIADASDSTQRDCQGLPPWRSRSPGAARRVAQYRGGRICRARRPVRLRQIDADEYARLFGSPDFG